MDFSHSKYSKMSCLSSRWSTTTAMEDLDSPFTEAVPRRLPGSLARLWKSKARVQKLACELVANSLPSLKRSRYSVFNVFFNPCLCNSHATWKRCTCHCWFTCNKMLGNKWHHESTALFERLFTIVSYTFTSSALTRICANWHLNAALNLKHWRVRLSSLDLD